MTANFDVARILSFGTVGLGFLLAFLAYQLLRKEQSVEHPRENILKAINYYMMFSISLCILGLASEVYRDFSHNNASTQTAVQNTNTPLPLDPHDQPVAIEVADNFLSKINTNDIAGAYAMLDSMAKHMVPFSTFSAQCRLIKNAFGAGNGRIFNSAFRGTGATPDGTTMYYVVNFQTSYEKDPNANEVVSMTKNDAGSFEVASFNIK
jgi:hypothetical protein